MSPETLAPAIRPAIEAIRLDNPLAPHAARLVGIQRMVEDN
jgi:hypothetical protein